MKGRCNCRTISGYSEVSGDSDLDWLTAIRKESGRIC
jgi:hypothetical protein